MSDRPFLFINKQKCGGIFFCIDYRIQTCMLTNFSIDFFPDVGSSKKKKKIAGLIFIDTIVKSVLGRDVRILQNHKFLAGSLGLGSGVMVNKSNLLSLSLPFKLLNTYHYSAAWRNDKWNWTWRLVDSSFVVCWRCDDKQNSRHHRKHDLCEFRIEQEAINSKGGMKKTCLFPEADSGRIPFCALPPSSHCGCSCYCSCSPQ